MNQIFTSVDIMSFPMLDEYTTLKTHFSKTDWIDAFKKLPVTGKNNKIAESHKTEGNNTYALRHFHGAIRIYTQGLLIAKYNSSTYGTIVANISACLFELKLWEKCIYFIDTCLASDYPETYRPKLYIRKIKAFVNLREQTQAEESLEHFKDFIIKCCTSQQEKYVQLGEAALNVEAMTDAYRQEFVKPDFQENPNVLNICKNAALRYNQEYGRHIVAAKTIKKGECILMEKPYASIGLARCPNCFKLNRNIVTCNKCPGMLYCSQECMNEDEIIHKWECSLLKRNTFLKLDSTLLIAFRIFLKGLQSGYKSNTTKVEDDLLFGDKDNNFPYVQQLSSKFSAIQPTKKILYVEGCCLLLAYISTNQSLYYWINKKMGTDLFMIGKTIMQIISICDINIRENVDDDYNQIVLYPSLSLFNHSCVATTNVCLQEDTIVVLALEDINVGQQIFINYFKPCKHNYISRSPPMKSHPEFGVCCEEFSRRDRMNILTKLYFFKCKCKKCALDYAKEGGAMQCPKCNIYVDVEGGLLNCTKCHNITKLNWETILKIRNFTESEDMINSDWSIFNKRVKLANELNLNPKSFAMETLYKNFVLIQIILGNVDGIHKYFRFIRNKQVNFVVQRNNIHILKGFTAFTKKAYLLENWHTPTLTELTIRELLEHLEYLKEYFLLRCALKGILKEIDMLTAYYNIQIDIIEFRKSNNWTIK